MRLIISILVSSLALACGEDPTQLRGGPPAVVDGALAYLDTTNRSLVLVDPDGQAGPDRKQLARLPAGDAPVIAISVPRPDQPWRRQAVVVDPGAQELRVIRDRAGNVDRLPIGVPLETIDVSSDGRWAVVYHRDGSTPAGSFFTFPNTIAVVDLHPDSPRSAALRLGSGGARPLRAAFSKELTLTGTAPDGLTVTERVHLAVMFVEGGIVPVDLDRQRVGNMVPLRGRDDGDVIPAEVLFTNNRGDALAGVTDGLERAFVRTEAGELYVLVILLSPERLTGDRDAPPVVVALENVVTPDVNVRDAELFFAPEGNALLLAAADDELIVVNGYTGVATRFSQSVRVDTLERFEDPVTGRGLALGYCRSTPDDVMLRLDPLGLDRRRSTGVEEVELGAPVSSLDLVAGAGVAWVHYADGLEMGVLDLTSRGGVLDMRFARTPTARALAPEGDRLWIVGQSPDTDAPHLAEVQLASELAASDVRIDRPGRSVGRAGGWVFVDHPEPEGAVTLFPLGELRRESAVAYHAVLLTDLFDAEPPTAEPHPYSAPVIHLQAE